jgi:phenylpropionate dioxygenase-like ring-hydroxylating dioxygenase large terminal subunit
MNELSGIDAGFGMSVDSVGLHQSWFPVCLASELENGTVKGIDFISTRVVAYRDATQKAVVQSAWCPHLGADLSQGDLDAGQIRCPYHHWRFDSSGACAHIPAGDKIPPGARIFTYPTAEAWGLIWAFNGEVPLFDLPRIPDAAESDLAIEAYMRGTREVPPWMSVSNGVDFQHLRTLHQFPTASTPETLDVRDHSIEFRIETPSYLQHGLITGTNAFSQHLRLPAMDMFMLFAGAPIDRRRGRAFFVIGVRKETDEAGVQIARKKLEGLRAFVEKLLGEDEPVLNTMRFRKGVMVASDRHMSRYFKYVSEFPCAAPPGI